MNSCPPDPEVLTAAAVDHGSGRPVRAAEAWIGPRASPSTVRRTKCGIRERLSGVATAPLGYGLSVSSLVCCSSTPCSRGSSSGWRVTAGGAASGRLSVFSAPDRVSDRACNPFQAAACRLRGLDGGVGTRAANKGRGRGARGRCSRVPHLRVHQRRVGDRVSEVPGDTSRVTWIFARRLALWLTVAPGLSPAP